MSTEEFALDINPDLAIVSARGESERLLGVTCAQISEDPNFLIRQLHPDDLKTLRAHLTNTETSSASNYLHLRLRSSDNKLWIFWVSLSQKESLETVSLSFVDVRNITNSLTGLDSDLIRVLMETTDDFIFFKDAHHVLLTASKSMTNLCEPIDKWQDFNGKIDYQVFPEEMAENYYILEKLVYSGHDVAQDIQPIIRKDGSQGWVDNRKYPIKNSSGEVIGLYGVARDVTAQINAMHEHKLAASVFDNTSDSIVVVDENATVLNANHIFAKTVGKTVDEVVGQHLQYVRHANDGDKAFNRRWQEIKTKGAWQGELEVFLPNGKVITELARYNAVIDESGKSIWYVGIYTDITAIRKHTRELEYAASHDLLTGLPNRTLLADRLNSALATAKRYNKEVVVAYIDLDGFKKINDDLGHSEGDLFLINVSQVMLDCLRESDTLARVGGDEFVAILTNPDGLGDYRSVIHRLLSSIRSTTDSSGKYSCSASIGISGYPQDSDLAEELVKQADHAMYYVKQSGKGTYATFDAIEDISTSPIENFVKYHLGGE